MRLSMLPVSIAAHFVAFAAFLFVPLAGGVEAPTPWPLSSAPRVHHRRAGAAAGR